MLMHYLARKKASAKYHRQDVVMFIFFATIGVMLFIAVSLTPQLNQNHGLAFSLWLGGFFLIALGYCAAHRSLVNPLVFLLAGALPVIICVAWLLIAVWLFCNVSPNVSIVTSTFLGGACGYIVATLTK